MYGLLISGSWSGRGRYGRRVCPVTFTESVECLSLMLMSEAVNVSAEMSRVSSVYSMAVGLRPLQARSHALDIRLMMAIGPDGEALASSEALYIHGVATQ